MVKMSEANIQMAERVVTHAVEVEKVKLEDRDRQREHESDMHRTDKLGDLAKTLAPVLIENIRKNTSEHTKKEDPMTAQAKTQTSAAPLALELTAWIGQLEQDQRAKFWRAFDDDSRQLIESATRATSDAEVKALVEKMRDDLVSKNALDDLQGALIEAVGGAHAIALQAWLTRAVA